MEYLKRHLHFGPKDIPRRPAQTKLDPSPKEVEQFYVGRKPEREPKQYLPKEPLLREKAVPKKPAKVE